MKQLTEPPFVLVICTCVCVVGIIFGESLPATFSMIMAMTYIGFIAWLNRKLDIEKETLEKRLKQLEAKMENVETKLNFQ